MSHRNQSPIHGSPTNAQAQFRRVGWHFFSFFSFFFFSFFFSFFLLFFSFSFFFLSLFPLFFFLSFLSCSNAQAQFLRGRVALLFFFCFYYIRTFVAVNCVMQSEYEQLALLLPTRSQIMPCLDDQKTVAGLHGRAKHTLAAQSLQNPTHVPRLQLDALLRTRRRHPSMASQLGCVSSP